VAVLPAAHNDSVLTVTFSECHCAEAENIIMPIFNTANGDTKLICQNCQSSAMGEGKPDASDSLLRPVLSAAPSFSSSG